MTIQVNIHQVVALERVRSTIEVRGETVHVTNFYFVRDDGQRMNVVMFSDQIVEIEDKQQ